MTESQVEKRLEPLRTALRDLDTKVSAFITPAPPRQNLLQRNPAYGAIIAALISGGFFGFGLPRILDHSDKDFGLRVNASIDQKFKDNHFSELQTSIGQIVGRLNTLNDSVNILLGKSIKQAASLSVPDFKRQLPQIDGILNAARQDKILPDPGVIDDLRNKLAPLVKQNDAEAWQAIASLASYHSVFNENPLAGFQVRPITGSPTATKYDPGAPPLGDARPTASVPIGMATKDTGAMYEPIGTDLNPANVGANPLVKFEGGGVVLDGHHIRNVIFIGVHVVYNGGPLALDSAIFINCRFTVQRGQPGEQFLARSLDNERVTFTAGA